MESGRTRMKSQTGTIAIVSQSDEMVWPLLTIRGGVVMSKKTKLTLLSLARMMLPYRADFLLAVLVLDAMGSTAYLWTRNIWRGLTVKECSPVGAPIYLAASRPVRFNNWWFDICRMLNRYE